MLIGPTGNGVGITSFSMRMKLNSGFCVLYPFKFHLIPLGAYLKRELVNHISPQNVFVDVVPTVNRDEDDLPPNLNQCIVELACFRRTANAAYRNASG